jgi:hypothetical protein
MSTEPKKLTLSIPAGYYERLMQYAELTQQLNGEQTVPERIAENLLFRALDNLTHPFALPAHRDRTTVDGLAKAKQKNEQAELGRINPVTAWPELVTISSNVWRERLGKPVNGAKIGVIAADEITLQRVIIELTAELNNRQNSLLISPDTVGSFDEIAEEFTVSVESSTDLIKVLHFLPEKRSDWKHQLINPKNVLKVNTVLFAPSADLPEMPDKIAELAQVLNLKGLTQVYSLNEDQHRLTGKISRSWQQAMNIVIYAQDADQIQLLKNDFEE